MSALFELPNGRTIEQVNAYETEFLFNEIFINQVYLQQGIELRPDAIVFDIGANIGLFTLFIKDRFPDSQVFAFEPSPEVYELLQRNITCYCEGVRTFPYGLADEITTAAFQYYPGYSVISGFHTDQERDASIIISGSIACAQEPVTESARNEIRSVVRERLAQQTIYQCQMTTLSKIILEEDLDCIDLIKMDVEGSEWAILQGIQFEDWKKIQQIVMEVHDSAQLKKIESLLKQHDFKYLVEEDKLLKESGVYNVYAQRPTY